MTTRNAAIRIVAAVLIAVLAPAGATAGSPDDGTLSRETATAISAQFDHIFRAQRPDGALPLKGEFAFYGEHPILATVALDVHRGHSNAAFASRAAAAMARYYGFLFADRDANRNLLIETSDGAGGWIEEPGFNSLLALDMLSLARLNLELQRPWRALYWYEGSRLVQEAVVASTFDAGASYFFPRDASNGRLIREVRAFAALPVVFGGLVGDSHATTLIREYLLNPGTFSPEVPVRYLDQPATGDPAAELRRLMIADILATRGFDTDLDVALASYAPGRGSPATPQLRYLQERIAAIGSRRAHGSTPLALFSALVLALKPMDDAQIVAFQEAVDRIDGFDGSAEEDALTAMDDATRTVFTTVSTARDRLVENAFFDETALQELSGLDPSVTAKRLFDDVVQALRRVENGVFTARFGDARLSVVATLSRERAVIGSTISARWSLASLNEAVEFRSVGMRVRDQYVPLSDYGIELTPGSEPMRLTGSFALSVQQPGVLYPVPLTLVVDDGSGRRSHYTIWRSVYVEPPLDVAVSFPSGRMLDQGTVPVDVNVVNRSGERTTVAYEWFSPTGLRLEQGRSAEWTIETGVDSASARLDVIVPSPCRPGRFPFKLKLYANGVDLGTYASTFYKPYQWVFIGPFPDSRDAIATAYPPEQRIELLATYDGADGRIEWRPLGPETYNQHGEVALAREMPSRGAGYLHTVIESPYDTSLPALLWANTDAALFINGVRILDFDPSGQKEAGYARVRLERGLNNILVKIVGDGSTRAYFNLGDESDEASYAFNNNLWELIDGYAAFYRRSQGERAEDGIAQQLVTLHYDDPSANSVAVVGSFNGWSPEHSRLRKVGDGRWEITLSLTPGRHAYRFVVNNRQQIVDPNNSRVEPDGFGGENSIIVIE